MERSCPIGNDLHAEVLIQTRLHCYFRCKLVDIIAFLVKDKYIDIYIIGRERPIQILGPLQALEEKLFPFYFRRTHKSCIIGLRHLLSIERETVLLSQRIEMPLHASFRKGLTEGFIVFN